MLTEPPAQTNGTRQSKSSPTGYDGFQTSFAAEPNSVRDALRCAVARFARRITPEDAGTLELALAEVLNNVVEHAYSGMPPGLVELHLWRADGSLQCRVEDAGHPMPDLLLPRGAMQPVASTVEDLAEGGWGWALMGDLTADIEYVREDGRNRLTFCIPLAVR